METLSQIIEEWHLGGLAIGAATFLIIGLFHPLVIKAEYYFGVRSWWAFLMLGIAMCAVSVIADSAIVSILAGVVAFSSFWSILDAPLQDTGSIGFHQFLQGFYGFALQFD